jgi:hypothetical protein
MWVSICSFLKKLIWDSVRSDLFDALAFILLLEMTYLSNIRVIAFYENADERPIWSKKFIAKAKRCSFKDFLGKMSIPENR